MMPSLHRLIMPTSLQALLDHLSDTKVVRRLSLAFAEFIGQLQAQAASPALIVASVVLCELEGRGHGCLMLDHLAEDATTLLDWPAEIWPQLHVAAAGLPTTALQWQHALAQSPSVWVVGELDFAQPLVLDGTRLYLRRYYQHEVAIAQAVVARASTHAPLDTQLIKTWLDRLFPSNPDLAPDWQRIACAIAVRSKVAIITGGPGTGKTYTVARLLALLFALQPDPLRLRVALAAPTGKAAVRLKQSIDDALISLADKVAPLPLAALVAQMGGARTLHRLLGSHPQQFGFTHHANHPLDIDVLVVDEASMVHLSMMAALLAALPPHTLLILLGDKDQLASVEAGAVLGDLCRTAQSGEYTAQTAHYLQETGCLAQHDATRGDLSALGQQIVMLQRSHRFKGPIGQLALAVNAGDAAGAIQHLQAQPQLDLAWHIPTQMDAFLQLAIHGRAGAPQGYQTYLSHLAQQPPATAPLAAHSAWVHGLLTAFEQFRVLCAVREGQWGVSGLNESIEAALHEAGLIQRKGPWYSGRPIMITRNDTSTHLYNGDIGITLPDPHRPGAFRVYFKEGESIRSILSTRLRHLATAYAMTVHKSQGSEFAHTVLVLPPASNPVLTRELIYTGITRASQRFTLVTPSTPVLTEAIHRRTTRASGLWTRLQSDSLPGATP